MKIGTPAIASIGFLLLALVSVMMYGCPKYKVYSQRSEGEAELARAESNRRIRVQEADALRESASKLAEAEVIRARGVAEANKIIGESLKGNEAYLRYLWIRNLEESEKTGSVIYVPTEAGLPILEAGKR